MRRARRRLHELRPDVQFVLFLDLDQGAESVAAAAHAVFSLLTRPDWRQRVKVVAGAPSGSLDQIEGALPVPTLQHTERLPLPPLAPEAIAAILADLAVPDGITRDALVARLTGQPVYFVVEAVRIWQEDSDLRNLPQDGVVNAVLERHLHRACRGDERLEEVFTGIAALGGILLASAPVPIPPRLPGAFRRSELLDGAARLPARWPSASPSV